jgi:ligand-binding sensor domain-containing protein
MAEDYLGRIWIGTHYSGLYRFDPSTGRFTVYKRVASNPKSLSDGRVNSVFIDRSGELWAATQNGLNKFDSINRNVQRLLRIRWSGGQRSFMHSRRRTWQTLDGH